MPTLDARLRRRNDVLVQRAQGKTVLLRLDDGSYYALDAVGGAVWELCDGRHSVADVIGAIVARFDAPEEDIRRDVLEFIAELQEEKLLA